MQHFAYWYYAGGAFLFGLLFGSFLNVCIYRLPRGLSVVTPRSACPGCHAPIAAYDNIPVLSWVLLRGRCRHCKQRISPRYAAVELLTGVFFLACYLHFGGEIGWTLKACVFSFLTLGLIFTDAETRTLPLELTVPGIVIGLALSLVVPVNGILMRRFVAESILASWWQSPRVLSFADAVFGALLAAALIQIVGVGYAKLRGLETSAMGIGDWKMGAMIGTFWGAAGAVLSLYLACLIGGVVGMLLLLRAYRRRLNFQRARGVEQKVARSRAVRWAMRRRLPFGVFLGVGAFVALFWGEPLMRWYFGLFV